MVDNLAVTGAEASHRRQRVACATQPKMNPWFAFMQGFGMLNASSHA